MAGRFQGTGRGSGGRGNGRASSQAGRGFSRTNNKPNGKNGLKEKKLHPLTRGKTPEYSFEEVKKSLLIKLATMKMDHIDDMIQSVKKMELFDIDGEEPTLQLLTDPNIPDRDARNQEIRADYTVDRKEWRARKIAFENNKRYVYGKVMAMCTEYMIDKLEREADFDNKLFDDPIELLKRIRKFMTITADTEWEYFGLWEAMSKLFSCRQKEKENIMEYRKRFEDNAEMVKSLIGDEFLDKFVEKTQMYVLAANKNTHKKETFERFMANGFIFNSDRAKYQSRIDAMTAQYTLKHLEYAQRCTFPTTLENAAEVLNHHKHDNRKNKSRNTNNANNQQKGGQNGDDKKNNEGGSQFAQKSRKCFVCGSEAHVAPDCEHKMRPREQWKNPERYKDYSRTNRQNMQREDDEKSASEREESKEDSREQWSYGEDGRRSDNQFLQRGEEQPVQGIMLYQRDNRRNDIHLDSGSTFHLRKDLGDVQSETVRDIPESFHYASNVNGRRVYQEALDNVFEELCKIDREATDNITSLSALVESGYNVFMDSERMNSFFVSKNDKTWRFGHNCGLYTLVNERPSMPAAYYNAARGMESGGIDPRLLTEINNYKAMAKILQRDRRMLGEPMNEYHDLWTWVKYVQWIYELGAYQRMDIEDFEGLGYNSSVPGDEFAEQAIFEGVQRDQHEWRDGTGFVWNGIARGQGNNPPMIHVVPNLDAEFDGYCALQSVEKNKEGYTKRQVERANVARSGYHMMGAPDPKLFKLAIRGNFFKNCPITEEDVIIAEKIYGPSASTLKGKRKRKTPEAVVDDWIDMPKELLEHNSTLDLCIDIMFINNVALFVSIDKAIKFRFCTELKNRTKDAIYKAIDEVLRIYNYGDFQIRTIYCDNEFKPVFDDVKDEMNVNMNYAAPGEHEPTIERSNQTLKALFRTHYHRMVYKAIPKVLTIAFIKHVTKVTNFYPAKGGISKHYSPHMIVKRKPVDFGKECIAEIGSYVQGFGHATNNSQRTRTIDGIYLGPTESIQGGHYLLDLNTKKPVTRPFVTVLPITKQVIKLVEEMAHDEGVRDLRTYHWKNGEIILDGDLLAGVDPDELWDTTYVPDENEYRRNDENLRNENIPQDEIDELLEEAEEFLNNNDTNDDEEAGEYEENRSVASIYEIREQQHLREEEETNEEQEMSDQIPMPNEAEKSDEQLNNEIVNIEKEIEQQTESAENTENNEVEVEQHGNNDEQTDELIARIEEQVKTYENEVDEVRDFMANLNDNNESSNESDDESDHEMKSNRNKKVWKGPERDPGEVRMKTRSGKSYRQDGIKMRPSISNNRERPRYNQEYLKKKKPKDNALKNRCAMRRKQKMHMLKGYLNEMIKLKEFKRNTSNKIESKYNLAFQQIGSDRKVEYGDNKAVLIARFMEQIKHNVRNEGVSFIQQYYLNKGLKIFKEDGEKAAMGELEQLVQRNCWSPIHVEEMTDLERKRAQDAMR